MAENFGMKKTFSFTCEKTSDLSAENRFKYEEGKCRSLAMVYRIETSNDH